MKTTAFPGSRLQFPSWSRLTTRVPYFIALMKLRVMALPVFTGAVSLFIAPGHLDPLLGAILIIGIRSAF
jgi:protoheme IX farnesyltransferase